MCAQVSTECDAHLSYNTQATIDKVRVSCALNLNSPWCCVKKVGPHLCLGHWTPVLNQLVAMQGLRLMDLYTKKGVDPKRIYIKVRPVFSNILSIFLMPSMRQLAAD